MTPQQITSADYLDIIFEGRNKAYGAFALRKGERSRQLFAMLFLILPFTALFLLQRYLQSTVKADISIESLIEINRPEDLIFETPEQQQKPAGDPAPKPAGGASSAATVPEIVEHVDKDTTVITEIPPSTPSDGNDKPGGTGTGDKPGGTGTGDKPGVKDIPGTDENKIEGIVDVQPQFNGDMSTWLQRALRYPEQEAVDGVEGRVVLKFIVERDGAVNGAEVVRSSGSAPLDKEALRVVKAMPNWQPGSVGGKPVRAYFSVPITFSLR